MFPASAPLLFFFIIATTTIATTTIATTTTALPAWSYDFDAFPSLWFGADVRGLQNRTMATFAAKHALAGWGWQQSTERTKYRFVETSIAQSIAQVRSLSSTNQPLFAYRHSQGAFPMFELSREVVMMAAANSEFHRNMFLQQNEQICMQGAPGGGFAMFFNWSSPQTQELWVDTIVEELTVESGVNACFFDETDANFCIPMSSQTNCSDFAPSDLVALQQDTWRGLAAVATKMNSAEMVPIFSSFNAFSERFLPTPPTAPTTWGRCTSASLGEEGLLEALNGTVWMRFYEFWVSTNDPASDAKMIANAILETSSSSPSSLLPPLPAGIILRQQLNTSIPQESVDYGIAAFFCVQSKYTYYGVSTDWFDESWQWWPQYDEGGCGAPLETCVRTGDFTFERKLERCHIKVNTQERVGKVLRV